MPRLSRTLTGPRDPEHCQACGVACEPTLWVECDERDQPDRPRNVVVALCPSCADQLIEPHPRLFIRLEKWRPFPGTMPLCMDCVSRRGLTCLHPAARWNGGPGLTLEYPEPHVAHVCGSGKRGRWGKTLYLFQGPVTACAEREVARAEIAA